MEHNTERIYDELLSGCFNGIKQLRDQWSYKQDGDPLLRVGPFNNVGGSDYEHYRFVVNESNNNIKKALIGIICRLLQEFEHHVDFVRIDKQDITVCYFAGVNNPIPMSHCNDETILAFVATEKNGRRILYVFKEFGINNRFPNNVIESIRKHIQFEDYRYISWVDRLAYTEVINHSENADDPGRGTKTYSLAFFFETFFSKDEYTLFLSKYKEFSQSIQDYFGISILKTLRPNVVFGYRKVVRADLLAYDYDAAIKMFSRNTLVASQKNLLNKQFLANGYMSALASHRGFAKCFMTAEWLFDSLKQSAGFIDLTAISMGYFKAIEQFMYDFVGLHTSEKDGKRREMPFFNDQGEYWLHFTDALYTDKKKSITLGNLAKFFKNRNNLDLLSNGLDTSTIDVLRDVLSKVSDQRNGYFHKDNIDDWEKIEKARALAHAVFFLMLGAYRYSDTDKEEMGILPPYVPEEYEKVFHYINQRRFDHDMLGIPVLYLSEGSEKHDYWMICPDNNVTFDDYGDPHYSGIYLRRRTEKQSTLKLMRDELPDTIFEGTLAIGINQTSLTPTGPQRMIYSQGKYML